MGTTTKSLLDIVDAVDSSSFQVIAQIHDMAVNDVDVSNSIRALGDRIKQVHIADVTGVNPLSELGSSTVLPGRGILDVSGIFKALKDVGFDGEIAIEKTLGEDPVSDLIETRDFIDSKWKQA